jgi:hypothetical protein
MEARIERNGPRNGTRGKNDDETKQSKDGEIQRPETDAPQNYRDRR